MPGTVSTACKTFQKLLRNVWASGSTYSEMTLFLGVTKDQLFRLRDRLSLPLRLDRSQRKKPPRHADPTPDEIAQRCAEIRAQHMQARRDESSLRVYRRPFEYVIYKLERAAGSDGPELEQLIDDMG